MAARVHLNEVFIMSFDVDNKAVESTERWLRENHFGWDYQRFMDESLFRVPCDNFTDAANIETYLQRPR